MFVAVDAAAGRAVAGPAVATATAGAAATGDADGVYECLFCGESLTYAGETHGSTGRFEYFTHDRRGNDCCANANASGWHRLGQEVVAQRLYNWLPHGNRAVHLDVERRVGTASEFIIADIRVTMPVQLAVEVVYTNRKLDLRRRLQTVFDQGYAAMVMLLTNGALTPASIERSLTQIGTVEIGRVDPETKQVQLGSIITPEDIDFETPQWEVVPAYLC